MCLRGVLRLVDDLADSIAASNAKSLEQRTAEAIEWLSVSVVEIANSSLDEAELNRRLEGEMHVSLAEILGTPRPAW